MTRVMKRTVKIEVVENPVPLDEVLSELAKTIAAAMYREDQEKAEEEKP